MKILFFLLLLPLSLHARFASKPETLSVLNNLDIVIIVKANGTYMVQTTMDFEILKPKELGLKQFPISYRPSISKFSFMSGYVLQGDNKTLIQQSDITPGPATDVASGEDLVKTMYVNIPPLEVGSKLRLSYLTEFTKVFISGQFAYTLNFLDFDSFIEAGTFQISSELPLHFKLSDPYQSLKVEQQFKNNQQLKIVFTKPIVQALVEEKGMFLSGAQTTAISVGTSEGWNQIKRNFRSLFDVVLNSTMIPEMEAVVVEARKKNDLNSQLEIINTHLSSTFRLNGFMQTFNAKPILRMPKDLYKMRMADNQELSAMMVMMLRKLNYKADVVLALRNSKEKYRGLPSAAYFNHVLVKVESSGETFFVDPTGMPFYGTNHGSLFSGNPYLGLNDENEIEFVPYHNPIEAQNILETKYTYAPDLSASVESEMKSFGGSAYKILQTNLVQGKEQAHRDITNLLTAGEPADKVVVAPYTLDTKIYTPLTLSAKYHLKKPTEAFVTLSFPQSLQTLLLDHSTWAADLDLGEPRVSKSTRTYVNLPVSANLKIVCKISSRWLDFSRKTILQKNALVVYEDHAIKLPFVTNKELNSAEFMSFQAYLKACAEDKKITLQK